MRIGLFADSYTPQVSGVVTVLRVLKAGLEQRGHTVFVFTVEHEDAEPDPSVIRVKSIQFPSEPQHRIGYFSRSDLLKKAAECKLDLIHSHTEFSLHIAAKLVSRKLKIPSVHTLHTYYPDYLYYVPLFEPFLRNREHKLLKKVLKSQSCIIAPSYKIYNYLEKHDFKQNMRVVPNGIELAAFRQNGKSHDPETVRAFKEKHGLTDRNEILVFVGRLAVEKNLEVLLSNFEKIAKSRPNARLLLVGDGPDRRELTKLVEKMGLENSVHFLGYLDWPEEVSTCYAAASMFISASHSEVHPITFIEAMASGLPIVCAQDVSIRDMVLNGENGWALDNDHMLWEKAVEILENPEMGRQMGLKSAELSANYSTDVFVSRMIKLYEEYSK